MLPSLPALLPQLIAVSNYLPDLGQVLLFGSSQLLIIYLRIVYSRESEKNFFELIFWAHCGHE